MVNVMVIAKDMQRGCVVKMDEYKKCPFCNISDKKILKKNDTLMIINSKFPVTPRGHLLVIPIEHVEDTDFKAVPDREMMIFINNGIDVLRKRGFINFNIGWNLGPRAGQTVKHMHCHIIGRRKGDVEDPRGGIRNVIPKKGNYLK